MTMPATPAAMRQPPRNAGITNAPEIGAYVIAQMAKLAVIYALSFAGVLSPLYMWAMHAGGRPAFFAVSIAFSVVWGALTLAVFFALRAPLGGAPPYAPLGAEIGIFALAYAIVTTLQFVVSATMLAPIYAELGRKFAPLLGFGLSVVFAAVAFVTFIGLRQLVRREASA